MPFSGESYDPATLAILTRAFDAAWQEVESANVTSLINDASNTRRIMALRIMNAAKSGERDPDRLRLLALQGIDGRTVNG